MGQKIYESRGRWFLNHQLWQLKSGEEIRAAARAATVRLVDAAYRGKDEKEAAGKPAEILLSQVTAGQSDSGLPSQEELAAKAEAKAKAEAEAKAAAEAKAKEEAEAAAAAESKAKAAAKAAAEAQAEAK